MSCDEASTTPVTTEPRRSLRALWASPVTQVVALAGLMALAACAADQAIERPTPLLGEVPIEYPVELWDQDVEGETLLRVLVSEEGAVGRVEILHSSGYTQLDSAAVRGARALRFQPAMRNGRRIEVWATVPVSFSKK